MLRKRVGVGKYELRGGGLRCSFRRLLLPLRLDPAAAFDVRLAVQVPRAVARELRPQATRIPREGSVIAARAIAGWGVQGDPRTDRVPLCPVGQSEHKIIR